VDFEREPRERLCDSHSLEGRRLDRLEAVHLREIPHLTGRGLTAALEACLVPDEEYVRARERE
jgi:hypothetical protein